MISLASMKKTKLFLGFCSCLIIIILNSCSTSDEGAYLFAHMLKEDYGRLYYSISRDGLQWTMLNDSNSVAPSYRGHPDICKGADGCFYMIGAGESPPRPLLWKSEDLLSWKIARELPVSLFTNNGTGYSANPAWFGAPKIFFDKSSGNYLITWHAAKVGIAPGNDWWRSMRTFYSLTPDFEEFTKPKRLFDFDGDDASMATIDVIIRKSGSAYYALIKDERWPQDSPTGKTIRIATAGNLTGPYSKPGPPITPPWFEAPSIVPTHNNKGWYIFAESYPNSYMLFQSDSLTGKWSAMELELEGVRHGCVIRISEDQYDSFHDKKY